jgi:hypothetical protein
VDDIDMGNSGADERRDDTRVLAVGHSWQAS